MIGFQPGIISHQPVNSRETHISKQYYLQYFRKTNDIFSKHALAFRLSEYWNYSKSLSLTIIFILYKFHKISPHNSTYTVSMIDILIKHPIPFCHWKHINSRLYKVNSHIAEQQNHLKTELN